MPSGLLIPLIVAAFTIAILLAVVLALVRHLRLLSATMRRFQEEVEPLLRNIEAESERARQRVQEAPNRLGRDGPGGRIRP